MLELADTLRKLGPQAFGLNQFRVYLQVTSGVDNFGEGTTSQTETEITLLDGYAPKVSRMSSEDVIASGGLYKNMDLRVGPLTPAYGISGFDPEDLDPPIGSNQRITFRVTGPGMAPAGSLYKKVGVYLEDEFSYTLILRSMGAQ